MRGIRYLDFFYGKESEHFAFVTIPKVILHDPEYKDVLWLESKMLYGVLVDRMELSIKNKWFDENGRAFIYYSVEEVMDVIGCGRNKAINSLKQLEEYGLILREKHGQGKATTIYVKRFCWRELTEAEFRAIPKDSLKFKIQTSEQFLLKKDDCTENVPEAASMPESQNNSETTYFSRNVIPFAKNDEQERQTFSSQSDCQAPQTIPSQSDCQALQTIPSPIDDPANMSATADEPSVSLPANVSNSEKPENLTPAEIPSQNPDVPYTPVDEKSLKFKNQTSRSLNSKRLEVYFRDPNETNINNTKYNNISISTPIISPEREGVDVDNHTLEKYQAYQDMICRNIEYDVLVQDHPHDQDMIDNFVDLMADVMMLPDDSQIRVGGDLRYVQLVKSQFMKINMDHIQYVLMCLKNNKTKVSRIRPYLLTALYNSPMTMDSYYRELVNHDMLWIYN